MEEEGKQRLGNVFKKSMFKEEKIEVTRLNSELQTFTGILIWNELSVNVKQANNKQIFRKKL